jgi:hypothetical protein
MYIEMYSGQHGPFYLACFLYKKCLRLVVLFQMNLLAPFSVSKLVAAGSSEMLVTTYDTSRCHKSEDHNLIFTALKSSNFIVFFIINYRCV